MRTSKFLQYGTILLLLLAAFGVLIAPVAAQGTVDLVINPATTTVEPGDNFAMTVAVQSSGQQMDVVEVHLSFDPTILQVVSLTPNSGALLPVVLVPAAFDNVAGQIDFGAATFSNFPSGNFNLLTIQFAATSTGTSPISFIDPAGPPSTIVTFGGGNVLGTSTGASVTVEEPAPVNVAPSVEAGANQSITLPTNLVNLDAMVTDDGLPSGALTLSWSVTGGNAANVSFSDASVEDPTVTFSAAGVYTLQLSADDGELSDSDTVVITVNEEVPSNTAPSVDAGANQSITLPTNSVNLDATVTDDGLPSGALTLSWSVTGGDAANVSFSDASVEDPTATFSAAGVYTLQLSANDGELSDSDTVVITVNDEQTPVNTAPSVEAGANQSITLPTNSVNLDATVTDDGLPSGALTFSWSVTGGDAANVSFSDASVEDPTATFSMAGVYTLQLTADDGDLSDSDTVTITVNPEVQTGEAFLVISGPANNPVVGTPFSVTVEIQSGAQQVDTGEIHLDFDPAVLQVNSVTPGTALTTALQNAFDNSAGTIDFAAGILAGTRPSGTFDLLTIEFQPIAEGQTGISVAPNVFPRISLILFEGSNLLAGIIGDPTLITIEAAQQNSAPSVDAGTDQTITLPDDSVELDATVTDDGLPSGTVGLLWSVTGGDAANVSFSDDTAEDPTVTFTAAGVYELTLTADDGELSADDSVMITVNEPVAVDDVFIVLSPDTSNTIVGDTFDIVVEVQAGTQTVDAAEIHLDFDASVLQVVSLTPGSTLGMELIAPTFDNATGEIDYAAGKLTAPFPSGTFELLTITFEALQTTDASGTTIDFAPMVFPRLTQATFAGNDVLIGTSGATVVVEDTATVIGSVLLQGRQPAPNSAWSVPLTVKLYEVGSSTPSYEFTPTTDQSGVFTISGIAPGEYEIAVKNSKTLQVVETVTLTTGTNNIAFGTLLAGDANDDNFITLPDFSIVAGSFNLSLGDPGYDARADFNENDFVTLSDFSLLASNFNTAGEEPGTASVSTTEVIVASSDLDAVNLSERMRTVDEVQRELIASTAAVDDVYIVFDPSTTNVNAADGNFFVSVYAQTGAQPIDGAEMYIEFDPSVVTVANLTVGTSLSLGLVPANADNATGLISYGYGTITQPFPSGDVLLLTIEFIPNPAGGSTALTFTDAPTGPGTTNVTSGGVDVLTEAVDGQINITGPNQAPIASDDAFTMDEDGLLDEDVSTNDNDPDSDPLTFSLLTNVSNGSLVFNSDGSFTYTPNLNYFGSDSFTYEVSDGEDTDDATVTISIEPVNDAPVAVDDSATTDEEVPVVISILTNDTDVEGDSLFVLSVGAASNGSVVIDSGSTTVTYTPNTDFFGVDSFSYTVTDGNGGNDTATVTVTVNDLPEPNTPPVAENALFDIDEDTILNDSVAGDASDADSDPLTFSLLTNVSNGSLVFNSDGSFTYTPNLNYFGSDSFTYEVSDGEDTDDATVTISIEPVNDAPVAVDDSATTDEEVPVVISILTNDTDVEGDSLFVLSVGAASNGSVVIDSGSTTVTYTPNTDFFGVDSFSYTVTDGNGGNDTATVTITVNDVDEPNTPPVAEDALFDIDEDTVLASSVAGDASDADSDPLTFSLLTNVSNGSLVFNSDGSFTYTPNLNYFGSDSFTYEVSDGEDTDDATVTISIEPVNDAPVAVDDSTTTDEEVPVVISVLTNDTDVEGDSLFVLSVGAASNGSVVIDSGSTTVTYTPNTDFFGVDSFSYTVTDGNGGNDTATVTVTVNDVDEPNTPPVADAGPDQTVTDTDNSGSELVFLDGSGSTDSDGTIVSYIWRVGGVQIAVGENTSYSFAVGTTEVELTATDDDGATDTDTVLITVEAPPNQPPTITPIANQTNTVGDVISLQAMGNDPEGLALRYGATGLPSGLTIDPVSGLISGTVNTAGVFTVEVTVMDSEGQEASTTFGWIVNDPTPSPTTPAPTETTPAPTETTPAPTETTPAPTETTPAPTGTTPAPTETTPAPTETTPAPTETTPAPTETTPAPTETTPAPTETTPAPTETTPAPTETTPAPTETTPAPTETTPAPTTPAPTTPAPGLANDVSVCWVEDQNGATTVWQVTNPNRVPLQPGSQAKVVFDWVTYNAAGAPLQSAMRWDQTGDVRINTSLASRIDVTWFIFDNALSAPLGTVTIYATEAYRCED